MKLFETVDSIHSINYLKNNHSQLITAFKIITSISQLIYLRLEKRNLQLPPHDNPNRTVVPQNIHIEKLNG